MLTSTFLHVPGVGQKKELELWESGIFSWEELLDTPLPEVKGLQSRMRKPIEESLLNLEDRNPHYFTNLLPPQEYWRIFPEFRENVAYIDIETSGGSFDYGHVITSIALYDGEEVKWYVHGENLRNFQDEVFDYSVLVTFNGLTFDLPFIERYFNIRLDHSHIDLRYLLRDLGYRGGLKKVEKALEIDREELDGVDGLFAVALWQDYQRSGDRKALETLLAYNIEDVVNLETLLVKAYNMKIQETPFLFERRIRDPIAPALPFQADIETIERIRDEIDRQTPPPNEL